MQQSNGKREIIIVLDWRAILGIFVMIFAAGWINGYRQSGEFQRLEAQNARVIQLLEGAEITQTPTAPELVERKRCDGSTTLVA